MMATYSTWFTKSLTCCFLVLVLLNDVVPGEPRDGKRDRDKEKGPCDVCKDITNSFFSGLKRTAKSNFGGGNTQWEEKALGSYAFSETRLIEIMEEICKDLSKECFPLIEQYEETIEKWWFKEYRKGTPLFDYFCIKKAKVCCANGTWGEDCKECAGGKDNPCSGHGNCYGEGTRGGTGQCECHAGYKTELCNECKEGYYEEANNKTHFICTICDKACDTSCWGPNPSGCDDCADGWDLKEDEGCFDQDECELGTHNCTVDQFCTNKPGTFKCVDCHPGCVGCTGAGPSLCRACKEGYYEYEDKEKNEKICEACDPSCKRCFDEGNEKCHECNTGYTMTDVNEADTCVDNDECKTTPPICLANQFCTNLPGTHKCTDCHKACETCTGAGFKNCVRCSKGYAFDEENSCKDINECESGDASCPGQNEECINIVGSYTCNCQSGFERNKENVCEKAKPKPTTKDKKGKKKKKQRSFDDEDSDWEAEKVKQIMKNKNINKKEVNPVPPSDKEKDDNENVGKDEL